MSGIIEVIIHDFTIVLPLEENATVASVSTAALQEYSNIGRTKARAPQKVLYTKDRRGRVLSGALSLPLKNDSDAAIEVVVEDYSEKDDISPSDLDRLYRDWQLYTANQIKDHIQILSFRDTPVNPDVSVLNLLSELSKASCAPVQLRCLSIFRLLLTKFVDKAIVIDAAEQISRIFVTCLAPEVALFALESFKDLSPLQLKLFDTGKYVRAMLDVQHHLLRFSPEIQSSLFAAFESIASLLEDEELQRALQHQREQKESLSDTAKEEFTKELLSTPNVSERPSSTSVNRNWNISRLMSLLQSDDNKIRVYGLEKLRKLLKQVAAKPEPEKSSLELIVSEQVDPPQDQPQNSISTQTEEESRPVTATVAATVAADKARRERDCSQFRFKDAAEVELIVNCLMLCLKGSIKARQGGGAPQRQRESAASEHQSSKLAQDSSEPSPPLSTAGKLIAQALKSKDTDKVAMHICIDCLHAIMMFPFDLSAETDFSSATAFRSRRINPLTATRLSNIQHVFSRALKDSYRLLFTLAHCNESGNGDSALDDLAEKAAMMFSLTIIHGAGWGISALQLETITLARFIMVQLPSYRLYMGLTYLSHLAEGNRGPRTLKGLPRAASIAFGVNEESVEANDSSIEFKLEEILSANKFMLLKSLWWWSIGERSNFLIRRLSFKCIARATVINSLGSFVWKLDPIPRLLEVLTKCYRPRGSHQRVAFLHREKINISSRDGEDCLSDDSYSGSDEDEGNDDYEEIDSQEEGSAPPFELGKPNSPVKVDVKLIRLVLKTLVNLVQAPSAQHQFTLQNKLQLNSYIDDLEIGADPDRGYPGLFLAHIAQKDRVIQAYYNILMDICSDDK